MCHKSVKIMKEKNAREKNTVDTFCMSCTDKCTHKHTPNFSVTGIVDFNVLNLLTKNSTLIF